MGTTTDTYNHLNEPAENYAEWKKANIKRLYIVQFHLQCSFFLFLNFTLKMPTLKKCRRDEWLPEVKGIGDGE